MKSRWRRSQSGQGLVEYTFIIIGIAIVVLAILTLMGPTIGTFFSGVTGGL